MTLVSESSVEYNPEAVREPGVMSHSEVIKVKSAFRMCAVWPRDTWEAAGDTHSFATVPHCLGGSFKDETGGKQEKASDKAQLLTA